MSVSVKYIDAPDGVQERLNIVAPVGQPFSNEASLSGDLIEDRAWATLETGGWPLDGSRELFEENPQSQYMGWWSKSCSDENGRFEVPPIITIRFPLNETISAPGLTFRFWPAMNSWCSEIGITWYREYASEGGENIQETILDHAIVYPDAAEWAVFHEVRDFSRVDIELLATNIPGQFAKLQQIRIGNVTVFLQDELVRVNLLNEIDPSSCELSVDTMTVEILEKKGRTLKPQKNQRMELYRDDNLIAVQYISDFSREKRNDYTFKCQSAIGRLEDMFLGGIYNEISARELLGNILDGFQFLVSASDFPEEAEKLTGYLPICTRREALQQIAFALGAVVSTRGDGIIRLLKLRDTVTSFGEDQIFTDAKLTNEQKTASVKITVHQYIETEESETVLENVTVPSSGALFTFSEPHFGYWLEGIGPQGGATGIEDYGANWVRLFGTKDGSSWSATVHAYKYQHLTTTHERVNPEASAAEKGNVISVDKATLIHSGNVDATLDRLEAFHAMKDVLTQTVVLDGQKVGDKVESVNPWGGVTIGYITSMEQDVSAFGRTAKIEIRGAEKPLEEMGV